MTTSHASVKLNGVKRPFALFVPILLLAVFLQFFQLGERSLWEDEAQVALKGEWDTIAILDYQKNFLFNIILSTWTRLGKSEAWLRIPSVLFALFSLIAFYEVGRRLFSEKTAQVAVLLLALSPFFLLESRQVKMYSLALLCSLLSFYFLLLYLEKGRSGTLLAHIGISLMALFTHYMFFFFLPLELLWLWIATKKRRALLKRYLLAWFFPLLLFLASIKPFWRHLESFYSLYLDSGTPILFTFPFGAAGRAAFLYYLLTVGPTFFPWNYVWAGAGCLLPLIVFFQIFRKPRQWPFLWIFLAFVFPVLLLSLFRNMQPRHLFIALPFYALALSAGLSQLRPLIRALALSGILLIQTVGVANYFTGRQYIFIAHLEPYREIVDLVQKNFLPGDLLFYSQDIPSFEFYFYKYFEKKGPRRRLHWIDKEERIRRWRLEDLNQKVLKGVKRIWFIERPPGQTVATIPLSDPEALYRENLAFRAILDGRFKRLGRWGFLKDPDIRKKEKFLKKFYLEERITVSLYDVTAPP